MLTRRRQAPCARGGRRRSGLRYNCRVWKETQTRRDRRNAVARVLLLVVLLLATAFGSFMVGRSQSPASLNVEGP